MHQNTFIVLSHFNYVCLIGLLQTAESLYILPMNLICSGSWIIFIYLTIRQHFNNSFLIISSRCKIQSVAVNDAVVHMSGCVKFSLLLKCQIWLMLIAFCMFEIIMLVSAPRDDPERALCASCVCYRRAINSVPLSVITVPVDAASPQGSFWSVKLSVANYTLPKQTWPLVSTIRMVNQFPLQYGTTIVTW